FQAMTQVAAGNECDRTANSLDRFADALAEAHVIFIRQKTVAQGDDLAAPAITLQKVKGNCSAVIEIVPLDSFHGQSVFTGDAGNRVEQFLVKFGVHGRRRRAEVGEVPEKLWPFVSNERGGLERGMRRN